MKCPKCGQALRVPAAAAAPAAAPQPAPAPAAAMTSLLDEAGVKAHVTDHRRRCPNCDTPVMDKAVLCVACGFHMETSKFVRGFSHKDGDATKYADILGGVAEEGHGSAAVTVLKKADVAILDDRREQKAAYRQGTPLGMLIITLSFIGSACVCMTLMPKGQALQVTGWISVVAASGVGLVTLGILCHRAYLEKTNEWLFCLCFPPYALYWGFVRRDSRQESVVLASAILAIVGGVALALWAETIPNTPMEEKKAALPARSAEAVAMATASLGRPRDACRLNLVTVTRSDVIRPRRWHPDRRGSARSPEISGRHQLR